MTVEQKLYTVEEFEAFIARPENHKRLFELIHGEIVEKVPTQEHGRIAGIFAGEFYIYFKRNPIGHAEVEVRHAMPGDEHNDRLPDVSITLDTTTPPVTEGPVLHMPDLVVEIQSPRDSRKAMLEKANYYLLNGTRIVWLVYPAKHTIEVITPDEQELFTIDETLDGGEVLPGFTLAVKAIFPV